MDVLDFCINLLLGIVRITNELRFENIRLNLLNAQLLGEIVWKLLQHSGCVVVIVVVTDLHK